MKRKHVAAIALIVVCIVAFGIELFREAGNHSRKIQNNYVFGSLSIQIEIFREEKGRYPNPLSELLSADYPDAKGKESIRELINLSQHNVWHDIYDYKPLTNGFVITMTGPETAPAGWFGKERKIEKSYKVGEAFKQWREMHEQ
jgi:hypothetical protein